MDGVKRQEMQLSSDETIAKDPFSQGVDLPHQTAVVVSGDSSRSELLTKELSSLGVFVTSIQPGNDVHQRINAASPNLIILDTAVSPPTSNSLLSQIKARKEFVDIPILTVDWSESAIGGDVYTGLGAEEHLEYESDKDQIGEQLKRLLVYAHLRRETGEYRALLIHERQRSDKLLDVVIPIGLALSVEKDFDRLLEMILLEAKKFCNADGGTLYLRTEQDDLEFVIMRNDSLNIALGGTTGKAIPFESVPMYDAESSEPNEHNVASCAALRGESINIFDAYHEDGFDFSGTRAFDERTGYRAQSFLTMPLKNTFGYVIGVLQLLNAIDDISGEVVGFDLAVQRMVEILAALATIALEAYIREQKLRDQIQQLSIEIDEIKKSREVAEITETDYFRQLRERARLFRRRSRARNADPSTPGSEQ